MMDWNQLIDRDWSLFLDRDGVINRRIIDGYVTRWEDFEFLPGVLEAMAVFAQRFKYIFLITNQQGVGKGLMTMEQLEEIHDKMCNEIENAGGRIDGILVCPQLASDPDNYRKPNPKMAFMAQQIAPDLDLGRCIMVGDGLVDMAFGHHAGNKTIFIGDIYQDADDSFESLQAFANTLKP